MAGAAAVAATRVRIAGIVVTVSTGAAGALVRAGAAVAVEEAAVDVDLEAEEGTIGVRLVIGSECSILRDCTIFQRSSLVRGRDTTQLSSSFEINLTLLFSCYSKVSSMRAS